MLMTEEEIICGLRLPKLIGKRAQAIAMKEATPHRSG
jgi:hypothetical protein